MGQRFWRIGMAVGYVGGSALLTGGGALVAVDMFDVRALLGAVLMLAGAGVLDRIEAEPPAAGR